MENIVGKLSCHVQQVSENGAVILERDLWGGVFWGHHENTVEMKIQLMAEIGGYWAKTQQGKLSRINFFTTFLV